MANSSPRIAKKFSLIFIFFVVVTVSCAQKPPGNETTPEINSLEQKLIKEYADFKEITFGVRGQNIQGVLQIRTTTTKSDRNSECHDLNSNHTINKVEIIDHKRAEYLLRVPKSEQGIVYLCLGQRVKNNNIVTNIFNSEYNWIHQGPGIKLDLNGEVQNAE